MSFDIFASFSTPAGAVIVSAAAMARSSPDRNFPWEGSWVTMLPSPVCSIRRRESSDH